MRKRAEEHTDPEELKKYGGGEFPLLYTEFAENGNYLETEKLSVRHGVCGDPEQVGLGAVRCGAVGCGRVCCLPSVCTYLIHNCGSLVHVCLKAFVQVIVPRLRYVIGFDEVKFRTFTSIMYLIRLSLGVCGTVRYAVRCSAVRYGEARYACAETLLCASCVSAVCLACCLFFDFFGIFRTCVVQG